MKYHFKIHEEGNGYWAECVELKGCLTQGDTMVELKYNMEEALDGYLDEPLDSNKEIIFPKKYIKGKDILEVSVSPGIAFVMLLRHFRDEKSISQNDIKKLLGINNILSYQRFARKTDPKLSTLAKIKKVIPEISIDYILDV